MVGVPLILKGTQEILSGKGLTLTDYSKIGLAFERVTNATSRKLRQTKKLITGMKEVLKKIKDTL